MSSEASLPIARALRLLSQDLKVTPGGSVAGDYVEGDDFVRVSQGASNPEDTPSADADADAAVGPNVLLVEDDAELARAIARVLERDGLRVTAVHSCAAALEIVGHFQNGIFDLHLPDGDGVELANQLRKFVGQAVFYSATTNLQTMRRAQSVGQFVSKVEGIKGLRAALLWKTAEQAKSHPPSNDPGAE